MTNKIALRTVEQFMADYKPVYQPIYPLFLGKAQQYNAEAGKLEFRRVETIGDIRAKVITPKDSELRNVAVYEKKKTYKKYFLANQFVISDLQDRQGVEEVVAQVLDEHQIQMEEMFLLGEGTSASTMINNGLFWSNDPNYTLESSYEVPAATQLASFYTKVMSNASKANQVAGRKVAIFYGTAKPLLNSLFPNSDTPVKTVIGDVLGANYSIVELPDAPTPATTGGIIMANLEQTKLHWTALPQLLTQGNNTEKMYLWFNFMFGSTMLEVLAKDAIVRQPITIGA